MALAQLVKRFHDGAIPGGTITDNGRTIRPTNPPPAEVGIACHQATFIWLWKAAHGSDIFPALDDIVGAQLVMNEMIRYGNPKRVSSSRPPEPEDVLIFDNDGYAAHSCVAIRGGADGLIGGYNQQNWFEGPVPVLQNDFSVYRVSQIRWSPQSHWYSGKQRAYDNTGNTRMKLWAVRGATAARRV